MKNNKKDFPKELAGKLANAASEVLFANGLAIGEAMKKLYKAVRAYDESIIDLERKKAKKE